MFNKNALISVTDKNNLAFLVSSLIENNYNIIATTSTAKAIKDLGYECQLVEDITDFPEMLGGRVKTLQPQVHGGILADLSNEDHLNDLKEYKIEPITLVVCNLYPFEQVLEDEINRHENVLKNNVNSMEIIESAAQMNSNLIENIDIGGVTLIRAASKNYKHVSLLCSPDDYPEFVSKLNDDSITLEYRKDLAAKGFIHTANYDSMIANYFMGSKEEMPQLLVSAPLNKKLRYGENPYQEAFYFESENDVPYSINTSKIIQGKELSYNNLLDIDAAYHAIYEFDKPCAIALKHNTPCGVGFDNDILKAYEKCFVNDPVSIFGGIVILNRMVNEDLALNLSEIFLEIIIAPDYSQEALDVFSKKKNLRVIKGDFNKEKYYDFQLKSITGGYLYQRAKEEILNFEVVSEKTINDDVEEKLINLFKVVKNVKSNAIVIGQGDVVLGISGGMVSRVDACEFALSKAIKNEAYNKNEPLLLASDGFFPFNDIVDLAKQYNIEYIIQPGGSINDEKLIKACNEENIAMAFTNIRYFKH
ncbi:phosphoribosylaminoimidazolecarboxamide formyltransferase/IMP cyclohydrolase [Bacilli bacterium PM5-3]|nr:phosphoribosylaminoimidazolecarboxamide formyltransferase/IMP cyclohydrolase [Bacilli bacterium PM5-3]MDH6603281.1 phosphoribosylaminoimidazolecarboxamide formyltransferase/IMP cyclohydrolase [Bacilli bacterium PM5-9]